MTWPPSVIFTVSAVKNGDKPQIYISLTWLLIIIALQYLPQNTWKSQIASISYSIIAATEIVCVTIYFFFYD